MKNYFFLWRGVWEKDMHIFNKSKLITPLQLFFKYTLMTAGFGDPIY